MAAPLMSHRLALPAGFMLEEYRIESVLGQGGFGITYLAHDTKLDAKVAIKEMLPKDFATRVAGVEVMPLAVGQEQGFAWARSRFIEEARHMARLNHPNIIRVYRYLEKHGTAYLVMEYVQGHIFEAWLKAHRNPTEQDLKAILMPVLDGLEHVHQHQLLHRDISPENIIITQGGRPILLDFGSARECLSPDHTGSGIIRPGYSPFEQYQLRTPQGPYTDIYALAAVMIRAIANASPPVAMDRAGQRDPFVPLAGRIKRNFSEPFLRAIDAGFAFYPKDRPQTVADWRSLFMRTAPAPVAPPAHVPAPPKKAPPVQHRTAPVRENIVKVRDQGTDNKARATWPIWGVLVLVLAMVGVGAWIYLSPPEEPKTKDDTNVSKKKELEKPVDPKPETHEEKKEKKEKKEEVIIITPPKKKDTRPKDHLNNSLGMEFVKVPGVDVMFCVHQTRRRDYAAFIREAAAMNSAWQKPAWSGVAVGASDDDPVVEVNWSDAEAFCTWLSKKEKLHYRLPLNKEWEVAAGKGTYPWGEAWPPKGDSGQPLGNFADRAASAAFGTNVEPLADYADSFATTSPVKSFSPNVAGLYDLGGNVREWCEDSPPSGLGLTRGASWRDGRSDLVGLHKPVEWGKEIRSPIVGFRCVLDAGGN